MSTSTITDASALRSGLLTFVSTLLPGAGLLGTPHKILGGAFVLADISAVGLLTWAFISGRLENYAFDVLASPNYLLYAAVLFALIGLLWAAAILVTFLVSRPKPFVKTWHKVVAGTLTAVFMVSVAAPAAGGTYYTLVTRNLITSGIFASDDTVVPQPQGQNPSDVTLTPVKTTTPWEGLERVNIMILGSDAGPDRTGTRPDVIMVASIDPKNGDTVLMTLPRNLQRAKFPAGTAGAKTFPRGFTYEEGLINSAWAWGEENSDLFPGDDNPGLTATEQLVSNTLGIDIQYYAVANMQGFEDIVNALGGVTVNVPRDLPIGKTGGPYDGYVKAGQNRLLNGYEALWYVRSRADSSDYDRMDRSRCMVSALTAAATPTEVVTSFSSLASALGDNVYTNISPSQLRDWAQLLVLVKNNDMRSVAFTADVINPGRPNYDKIQDLVQQALVEPSESVQTSEPTTPAQSSSSAPAASPAPSNTPSASSSAVQTASVVC